MNGMSCSHSRNQAGFVYMCQDCRAEEKHLRVWERELRKPDKEGFVIVAPEIIDLMYPRTD